ncbi:MAG TPA: hypothetical protein EYO40_09230 [Phycisphaerales bacterium]|nr:hypothetical protein [Phycisphaerales bacterium]
MKRQISTHRFFENQTLSVSASAQEAFGCDVYIMGFSMAIFALKKTQKLPQGADQSGCLLFFPLLLSPFFLSICILTLIYFS